MGCLRPAHATVLGTLLGLCPACSVADLTSADPASGIDTSPIDTSLHDAAPGDATGDHQSGQVESGLAPHDAGAEKAADGDAVDASDAVVPPTTAVLIENLDNNRYLEVANASNSNGAQVWAYSQTGATNQLWTFVAMTDGTYEIQNQNSGDCLDVPGNLTANGISMQQYGCWPVTEEVTNINQRWWLIPFADHIHIVGKGSGKCLWSSTQADGASVNLEECNGDLAEQWAIVQ